VFFFDKPPNLENYEEARRNFSWAEARGDLDGLRDGRLNIAYEAVDRYVLHALGGKTAIRWISKDNVRRDISYAELSTGTGRFTNALTMIVDEAEFDAARRYRILQEEKVTIWYTAPTAIRMLRPSRCAHSQRAFEICAFTK